MSRFAKQSDCPTSATLCAYGAGTLSFLSRPGVAAHLAACEFCDTELPLLIEHAPAVETTFAPPALPLALRLFAESKLADIAAAGRGAEKLAA